MSLAQHTIHLLLASTLLLGIGGMSSCDVLEGSAQDVVITTDAATYAPDGTIRVTVHNRLDRAITTVDQQSQCTIVRLERSEGDAWVPVLPCTLNTPSREVTLGPGTEMTVALDPHPSQPAVRPTPGHYRAVLIYTAGPHFEPASSATDTTASAPFTVK